MGRGLVEDSRVLFLRWLLGSLILFCVITDSSNSPTTSVVAKQLHVYLFKWLTNLQSFRI